LAGVGGFRLVSPTVGPLVPGPAVPRLSAGWRRGGAGGGGGGLRGAEFVFPRRSRAPPRRYLGCRRIPARRRMPLRLHRGARGKELCPARRSPGPALQRRPPHRRDQYEHRTADHDRGLSFGRFVVSVTGPLKQASADRPASRLHWVRANVAWSFGLFARKPKFAGPPLWRASLRLTVSTVVAVAIIAATMILVDAPAATAAQRAPVWLAETFDHITEL